MLDALAFLFVGALAAGPADAAACQALRAASPPTASVTIAEFRDAGPLTLAAAGPAQPASTPVVLPAHCRIVATLKPSSDSDIEVEVWLPVTWNGKFQMVGNGGWAGTISYPAMSVALTEGYATASTDTGHKGGNALFAIGHPEKLVDFAHRAVHETALASKALIEQYYARPARLSYFNGCSLGGRQALMEAHKYPNDFDAIVAGAPANYTAHLHTWDVATALPAAIDPAAAVPPAKLALVNRAVIAACDARDGVTDGLLNDPRSCRFDVATLECRGADSASCLTAPQVASMTRGYSALTTSRGEVVFPGKDFGSEIGWGVFLGGQVPALPLGSFLIAHGDANWDPRGLDLDRDLKLVEDRVGAIVDATSPDLGAFKARGGKLILYHGWNDVLISAGNTINYHASVAKALGGDQSSWMRLFMAPGMGHCAGGPGPNQINWMAALERWREAGVAPSQVDAAHVANNRVDMTRPLCPYPQVAVYTGVGSIHDAGNFSCTINAR